MKKRKKKKTTMRKDKVLYDRLLEIEFQCVVSGQSLRGLKSRLWSRKSGGRLVVLMAWWCFEMAGIERIRRSDWRWKRMKDR